MMTIVYSGENTEKEASDLFAQASLMDAKLPGKDFATSPSN